MRPQLSLEMRQKMLDIAKSLFDMNFEYAVTYHKSPSSINPDRPWYQIGIYDWLKDHSATLKDAGLYVLSGATKACILQKGQREWVIKVGFVPSEPEMVNYCELEAKYYDLACQNHLEDYFAATYKIGTHIAEDGTEIPIFAQQWAEVSTDNYDTKCLEYMSSGWYASIDDIPEEELDDYYCRIEDLDEDERVCAMYNCLSYEIKDLLEFIEEHDINDLHSENWGITNSGKTVMIDFSGYRG